MKHLLRRALFAVFFTLTISLPVVFSQQDKPQAHIQRTDARIVIDGVLDESVWESASRVSGFLETFPGDQTQPAYDTEVRFTYNDDFLYLAFIAYDDPATIRSALRQRDAIFNDDHVGIILDPYGDGSWAYAFYFNPRGIQGDRRITRDGEDTSFDIVHHSAGRVTEFGYIVEVAIPFRELRFPDRDLQTWNTTFWRVRPRSSREVSSWAPISRGDPCLLCQLGSLSGLQGVKGGNALRILPSVTATQSAARSNNDESLKNERVHIQPSLSLRYSLTPSLTAELTVNPDFSQIESDAGQIDVNSTTALSYDERRPFFQEGSDLYSSRIRQLYTRSINAPLAAVKLTGRLNRTSLAFMSAWDESSPVIVPFEERSRYLLRGQSLVNIGRVRQTFGSDNHVGFILTDRRFEEGGSGSTAGIDGRFRMSRTFSMGYHFVATHTDEGNYEDGFDDLTFHNGRHTAAFDGERFTGTGASVGLNQDGRHLKASVSYSQRSPEFRAHNGFVTQAGRRDVFANYQIVMYPNVSWIDEFRIMQNSGFMYNWDGLLKDRWIQPEFQIQLPGQTVVQSGYMWSNERFAGQRFPGIRRWQVNVSTQFTQSVSSGFSFENGRFIARSLSPSVLGKGHILHFYVHWLPDPRLEIQPSIAWQELRHPMSGEDIFSVYVIRNRLSYQFNRELYVRVVTEYDHGSGRFDIQPLLAYNLNPFSAFYMGTNRRYSHTEFDSSPFLQARQYFLKAQYLF